MDKNYLRPRIVGLLITVIFAAAVLLVTVFGARTIGGTAERQGLDALRSSIRRAVVECYALEGEYPPDLEYLKENYSLTVNNDRYIVIYVFVASNIMPQIDVLEKNN